MKSLFLCLTLESPVVVSRDGGTLGGHQSLTYIPGAALLGAVAAKGGYESFGERAFQVFHSGAVRFGDARIGASGVPAVAVPLAWHSEKGAGPLGRVTNLSRPPRAPGHGERGADLTGLEQRRGSYVLDNRLIEPRVEASLRTAVGDDGRARDGFLFGLEAISAGQEFFARVDADDADDLARVRDRLVDRVVRLGRSRGAEYGQVRVREVEQGAAPAPPPTQVESGVLLFYCASRLALRDHETGVPRLSPKPSDFGLGQDWRYNPSRSFLRVETYSPFHGKRMRPDLERQVLAPGSVLAFSRASGPSIDLGALRAALSRGIGAYVQDGLGQVDVEPAILAEHTYQPGPWIAAAKPTVADFPAEDSELVRWLRNRAGRRQADRHAFQVAERAANQVGPFKVPASQWGEVRRLSRESRFYENSEVWLMQALKDHMGKGVSRKRWERNHGGTTAKETVLALVEENTGKGLDWLATMLEQLAARKPGGDGT